MGIFLLPTFFKRVSKWLSSETLLVVSLALCLGMVVLADKVGFSTALGAFIMGSILAETTQSEKIEHLIASVKDLFGAIFFVSVGMLINPAILVEYAVPVLLLTLAVLLGKTLFVSAGALLAGKPLKQAVQAGTSMSQIGEFSFIIATLGLSLNVTSSYLYPIAVGVSVITTFTTPYMMKLSEPLYALLQKILPARWLAGLEKYSSSSQIIESESNWKKLLRFYFQVVVVNSVVIIALILLVSYILLPFVLLHFENQQLGRIITTVVALLLMAPFVWALTAKK